MWIEIPTSATRWFGTEVQVHTVQGSWQVWETTFRARQLSKVSSNGTSLGSTEGNGIDGSPWLSQSSISDSARERTDTMASE